MTQLFGPSFQLQVPVTRYQLVPVSGADSGSHHRTWLEVYQVIGRNRWVRPTKGNRPLRVIVETALIGRERPVEPVAGRRFMLLIKARAASGAVRQIPATTG